MDEAPGKAQVLVVEDDAAARRLLARALRGAGLTVIEAENGQRGLDLARSARPSLVITDVLMPDKDGIEFIRELRREDRQTKILATSGGGLAGRLDFLEIAIQFGADAILRKPFMIDELLKTVSRLLGTTGGPA